MLKRKSPKAESGQSIVLIAILLTVLCSFVALSVDLGLVYMERSNLQTAADAAALAGAKDLPNATTAKNTAVYYAGQNGIGSANVTVTSPYGGDATKIEVVCTQTVEYTLARIMGFTSRKVSARAVAEKTGMGGGPFGFAVFSGSPSATLSINGSNQYIGGSAGTNYKFSMNGSNQTITENLQAVSSVTANGSKITIGGTCQGSSISVNGSSINIGDKEYSAAPVLEMPDFAATIQAEATAAGTAYKGNKTYNGSNIKVNSPIYIDGNLTVNGSNFTGTGIIIASGNITFNGSNLENSGSCVCFYSESGDITINGSNITLDGIVYAPNGTITMNGSNQTINGRVIGDKVSFNGSNIHIFSDSGDLNCLPKNSIQLVE